MRQPDVITAGWKSVSAPFDWMFEWYLPRGGSVVVVVGGFYPVPLLRIGSEYGAGPWISLTQHALADSLEAEVDATAN